MDPSAMFASAYQRSGCSLEELANLLREDPCFNLGKEPTREETIAKLGRIIARRLDRSGYRAEMDDDDPIWDYLED